MDREGDACGTQTAMVHLNFKYVMTFRKYL